MHGIGIKVAWTLCGCSGSLLRLSTTRSVRNLSLFGLLTPGPLGWFATTLTLFVLLVLLALLVILVLGLVRLRLLVRL